MFGLERMSGLMKKHKWSWLVHAILIVLVAVSLIASASNLYTPRVLSDWISQFTSQDSGESTTDLNNMAISNENTADQSSNETETLISQSLIYHDGAGSFESVRDVSVIGNFKQFTSGLEFEANYEEESTYNIRNYTNNSSFIESELTNATPINLLFEDVSSLPSDLQEIQVTSIRYVVGSQELYLMNDDSDEAYTLTLTNDQSSLETSINDLLVNYENEFVSVSPVVIGGSPTYLTNEATDVDRLTYLQERQPNTYFLNHFFDTPDDIHDYSVNSISRYYTEGRQLTVNMETFEVTLLQDVASDVENVGLNDQIAIASNAIADILPDKETWLYTEYQNDADDLITYRKFIDSYPVFGNNYVSKTQVLLDGDQVRNINLSSLTVQTQITDLTDTYTVMSGVDALNLLNNAGYPNDEISELILGYRWVQNPDSNRLVELIPSWHVQIGNEWFMLEDLVDTSQYPSLETKDSESGDPIDLNEYFENLGNQESEEEVETPVDTDFTTALSLENEDFDPDVQNGVEEEED